jgi:hypothetical protein
LQTNICKYFSCDFFNFPATLPTSVGMRYRAAPLPENSDLRGLQIYLKKTL